MSFKDAVTVIFSHEGGYSHDPKDPGGETNYGISKRSYPDLDIRSLTRANAEAIYKRDFWNMVRGDALPFCVALMVFDFAVNAGIDRSIKLLQKAVGVKADGKFGDTTLAAINNMHKYNLAEKLAADRIMYYSMIRNFDVYGKGWVNRTIETLATGLLYKGD